MNTIDLAPTPDGSHDNLPRRPEVEAIFAELVLNYSLTEVKPDDMPLGAVTDGSDADADSDTAVVTAFERMAKKEEQGTYTWGSTTFPTPQGGGAPDKDDKAADWDD